MPRTRKQAARKTSVTDPKIKLMEFQKTYKHVIKTFDAEVRMSMAVLQSFLKSSRTLISPEIGNKLYEDVLKECLRLKEGAVEDASITSTCNTEFETVDAHSSMLQASPGDDHGDGDICSSEMQLVHSDADSTIKRVGFTKVLPPTRSEKWKTPAVNHVNPGVSAVTPKVKPEDCMSLLRFPAQGEMAISMHGSPLLVTSHVAQTTVNVQVPLPDGRVLSIQPGANFNPYEVPVLDTATRRQLLTITENIHSFVAMTDKAKHPWKK